MNFTNINGLDLTYYDIDFFGGPSGKTDYLMNDENTTTNNASYIKINKISFCYYIAIYIIYNVY